ncbi:peptide-methionine (S)-S-oxide reductase [Mesonia hippocampi]|uniref:Peptide methionine sulfoxide reductase MsrA n=1 Tax=Mesonia hippocampi TaxID=1628250 RepID=A0A840ES30_9FLAO|nr:peptide-methionine (S)-S-oxide reductase MsrA [Mesonia hippocampi]MBB4117747.1 peptide-methionine (S)-S-oxide reductase [Mesonia hippocampi]
MENNKLETATFAGGCFWCTEAVFKRIKGVERVLPGYTGGEVKNPCYREVAMGLTNHAEAIQIKYNPALISYQQLLAVFFATHDPTTLNRQANDVGKHYRSAIFYHNDKQYEIAKRVIKELNATIYNHKIVTELTLAKPFYNAESEHVDYYDLNKEQPYCQAIINPKINLLLTRFKSVLK